MYAKPTATLRVSDLIPIDEFTALSFQKKFLVTLLMLLMIFLLVQELMRVWVGIELITELIRTVLLI